MFLTRLTQAFTKAKVPYAVVGGYAVSLHGAVRGTLDIDIVIRFEQRDFIKAEEVLSDMGLEPRLPISAQEVFTFREEYIRNRNLVAWNFVNRRDPTEIVDIILTEDLTKLKTVRMKIDGENVVVVAIEDLIRMKNVSLRPQDKEDISALKKLR